MPMPQHSLKVRYHGLTPGKTHLITRRFPFGRHLTNRPEPNRLTRLQRPIHLLNQFLFITEHKK